MVTLDEGGWAAPAARLEKPPAELDTLVEHVFTVDFRGAEQRSWKILPDTCAHVIVKLVDGACSDHRTVTVVGARTRAVTTDVSGRSWAVGVRLRPGALHGWVGTSATRLTDRSETAGAIWGSDGDRLEREVDGADDPEQAKERLIAFLRRTHIGATGLDWRAEAFARLSRRSGGRIGVREAAKGIGVSSRALRDVARDQLGLAPKRYTRIERLFRALEAPRDAPWSRVAARAGFSDQSHLIRDFQDLLGETPTEFTARGRSMPIRSRQGRPSPQA